jgi:hypothetical protein
MAGCPDGACFCDSGFTPHRDGALHFVLAEVTSMMAVLLGLNLIVAFGVLDDSDQTSRIPMHSNAKNMKKEILRRIPLGSNIQIAKTLMEANDFRCEMMRHGTFSETTDDPTRPILHVGVDYLFCYKKKVVSPFITRSWDIMIVHDEGMINNIVVNIGLTGP